MQTHTCFLYENTWQNLDTNFLPGESYQLVLVFADRFLLEDPSNIAPLKQAFPAATIISCSTSGEIYERQVYDKSLVATAIHFDDTPLQFASANSADFANSRELGNQVASQLPAEELKYVLVISNGGKVNGSELVAAINETVGHDVIVTGGLAGDGARFEKTLVGINTDIDEGMVVLVGFYGEHIKIGYGLNGGWEVFGPERVITKSDQNVLFEIDHQNALQLYKKYLGKYAAELPGSALLFPLAIKTGNDETTVVRTILTIDEANQTMTFAGNVPEGAHVRLMKANFDELIYSAGKAAELANSFMSVTPPQLVLLISCVGRKLVLGKRIDEEVEAAADIFSSNPAITGFYSYGEISPLKKTASCELHNQTMTITTFCEI